MAKAIIFFGRCVMGQAMYNGVCRAGRKATQILPKPYDQEKEESV